MADPSTRRALVKAGALVALIVLGTAAWWLFGREWIGQFSDLTTVRATIARAGPWGPVIFALFYAGITLLPVPKAPVSVAAGAAFGLVFGTVYVYLGSLLGAGLAFVIGRRLGREAVERLTGARIRKLDAWLTRSGLSAVILVRLVVVVPFTLINYGAALTAVRTRDYALGTAIGILPGTFGLVALGGGFATGQLTPVIVGMTVLVVLSALAAFLRPKKTVRDPEPLTAPPTPRLPGDPR